MVPATVISPPVRLNKIVAALLIVVTVTAFEKVAFAFVLIVVAATVLLKVVVPASTVILNKGYVLPIVLVNVFPVPVTCKVPSVELLPLIIGVMFTAVFPAKII